MGIDMYKGMLPDEDEILDGVTKHIILERQLKGLHILRDWFWDIETTDPRVMIWNSKWLRDVNTMWIINYLNKCISGGWGEEHRGRLNDIRKFYLMNKGVKFPQPMATNLNWYFDN